MKPLLLLLAAASFAGVGLKLDGTEKEIEKLRGNWELVSFQLDGTPSEEYGLDKLQLAIVAFGDKIRLHVGCAGRIPAALGAPSAPYDYDRSCPLALRIKNFPAFLGSIVNGSAE